MNDSIPDVCEVTPRTSPIYTAYRWFPPGHERHGGDLADLLESRDVEEVGGHFIDPTTNQIINPGDWLVFQGPSEHDAGGMEVHSPEEFEKAYQVIGGDQ